MEQITFLAGLSTGIALVSLYGLYFLHQSNRKTDTERMIFINKVLVRNGSERAFTDEMITGVPREEREPREPMTFKTPFKLGLEKKAKEIAEDDRKAAGIHLSPEAKEEIRRQAEAIKRKQAA